MSNETVQTIIRCSAPFYVQFEVTKRCNNRCFFCYNALGDVSGEELSNCEVKRILGEIAAAGVFRVNLNGGEPMTRTDLLDICAFARGLGLEVHMNTNATLVTREIARGIASFMPSVCVSLLASTPVRHDRMAGRSGAFDDALRGMDLLAEHGVGMEVNVCTTMENYHELYSIAELAAQHGCYAFCSTRYILTTSADSHLVLTLQATLELIEILTKIKDQITGIDDVSLPGPVPLCELPRTSFDAVAALNIPCQYGYGLCRVSATGKVTPCTISSDVIADLRTVSFADAWNAVGWSKYSCMEHIPHACKSCEEFARCRAGCVVYDESLVANGMRPITRKWM